MRIFVPQSESWFKLHINLLLFLGKSSIRRFRIVRETISCSITAFLVIASHIDGILIGRPIIFASFPHLFARWAALSWTFFQTIRMRHSPATSVVRAIYRFSIAKMENLYFQFHSWRFRFVFENGGHFLYRKLF